MSGKYLIYKERSEQVSNLRNTEKQGEKYRLKSESRINGIKRLTLQHLFINVLLNQIQPGSIITTVTIITPTDSTVTMITITHTVTISRLEVQDTQGHKDHRKTELVLRVLQTQRGSKTIAEQSGRQAEHQLAIVRVRKPGCETRQGKENKVRKENSRK